MLCKEPALSRRQIFRGLAAAAGCAVLPHSLIFARESWQPAAQDETFLDELVRQGCLYFWEQASPRTGQILDRAHFNLGGARDHRKMASIASTGFGLTALCIADKRGYLPHAQVLDRVKATLKWHLNHMPEVHGFFYHFTHVETGARWRDSEVSSIDTSILLCGMLTAKAWFDDPQITDLAQQIYERVDWPWLLNGGSTFSMGWEPEGGFLTHRWDRYCELMMIYLLAIGSMAHPISPEVWKNFSRPVMHFEGYSYISGTDPIFTHQYSHAWFDFRNQPRCLRRLFRELRHRDSGAQRLLPRASRVVQPELLGRDGIGLGRRLYRVGWSAGHGTAGRDRCALRGRRIAAVSAR